VQRACSVSDAAWAKRGTSALQSTEAALSQTSMPRRVCCLPARVQTHAARDDSSTWETKACLFLCHHLRIQLGNKLVLVAQIPEQHGVRQR